MKTTKALVSFWMILIIVAICLVPLAAYDGINLGGIDANNNGRNQKCLNNISCKNFNISEDNLNNDLAKSPDQGEDFVIEYKQ